MLCTRAQRTRSNEVDVLISSGTNLHAAGRRQSVAPDPRGPAQPLDPEDGLAVALDLLAERPARLHLAALLMATLGHGDPTHERGHLRRAGGLHDLSDLPQDEARRPGRMRGRGVSQTLAKARGHWLAVSPAALCPPRRQRQGPNHQQQQQMLHGSGGVSNAVLCGLHKAFRRCCRTLLLCSAEEVE